MNMTPAFCVFAKTAVRERRIPFEISAKTDPFYSPSNMERLRKSVAQMEATGGTIHEGAVGVKDVALTISSLLIRI